MTNEEMAQKIKQCNDKKLTVQLWERVKKLLYMKSEKAYAALKERFCASGIDCEDIKQECYFVFNEALKGYSPPLKFVTFLELPFKSMIRRLLKRSCNVYTDNIDEVRDDNGYSLSETIADEKNDIFLLLEKSTDSEIVRGEVEKLGFKQRRVIKLYYFNNCCDKEIASRFDVKPVSVYNMRQRALSELRRSPLLRCLYNHHDYIHGRGGFLRPDRYYLKDKYIS